jgi:peptidoglycan/LPS O-acetylase OafA/YrhL
MGAMTVSSGRLAALDGWRAICAAFVILGHLPLASSIDPSSSALAHLCASIPGSLAKLGVEIFFVISGFVICRGFLHELEATGEVSLRAFYLRRSLRILPPLMLYVATIAALSALGIAPAHSARAVRALTFTCDLNTTWGVDCGGWLGGHTWSLSVEEQFYLVAPILFVISSYHRRWILVGASGLIVLTAGALAVIGRVAVAGLLTNFAFIGAGVVCALFDGPMQRLSLRLPGWLPVAAIGVMVVLARMTVATATVVSLPATLLLLAVIPAAVLSTAGRPPGLRSIPENPTLVAVGRASYGIYLWQELATYRWPGANILFYFVSVVACVALGFASYHGLERPLIRIGARLSERIKGSSAPAKQRDRAAIGRR